jgi:hypothetical protein
MADTCNGDTRKATIVQMKVVQSLGRLRRIYTFQQNIQSVRQGRDFLGRFQMPKLLKETFKAWVDEMPGAAHKLIVIGTVEVPTSGWTVVLARKEPQGFNPSILMLDVVSTPPHGMAMQVITNIALRYEEAPPRGSYSQVTVLSGADEVTVEVGTVH